MPEPISENRAEDDSVIIVCGPPKLKDSVAQIIEEMGWNNVFIYKWVTINFKFELIKVI